MCEFDIVIIKKVFAVSLFEPVFTDEVETVIRDMKNNEPVGSEIPIQIIKKSEFTCELTL